MLMKRPLNVVLSLVVCMSNTSMYETHVTACPVNSSVILITVGWLGNSVRVSERLPSPTRVATIMDIVVESIDVVDFAPFSSLFRVWFLDFCEILSFSCQPLSFFYKRLCVKKRKTSEELSVQVNLWKSAKNEFHKFSIFFLNQFFRVLRVF